MMNPFLATDGYKTGHYWMYPKGTSLVYSNFTPRSNKYGPEGCKEVLVVGTTMVMSMIHEMFETHFFERGKEEVCSEIKKEYSLYLGTDYDVSHIEELWDYGALPIYVKALREGTLCPIGVPVLTIVNTKPEFFWVTNFLETLLSNLLWKPMTSATIALAYKRLLKKWAQKTDPSNVDFVDFQGHDFSMRGMGSLQTTMTSGLGVASVFKGSDNMPAIHAVRRYYNDDNNTFVVGSVNATEHSVMCAGTKGDEIGTFRYLMEQFPKGILSIVSDTWDLWKVITEYLPQLKEEILERDGKIVIRPDSGDPVDIICGKTIMTEQEFSKFVYSNFFRWNVDHIVIENNGEYYPAFYDCYPDGCLSLFGADTDKKPLNIAEVKGVIELLWDIFGGTINDQGYKVLDPHIGAIYGDSITIERAEEICKRLEAKGFASTNIVLGVGSYTYQYNTRDTFGFAMKATYVELEDESGKTIKRNIFKDPVTDDGTKKSAKGLLSVQKDEEKGLVLIDQCDDLQEEKGYLRTIYYEGLRSIDSFSEIRDRIDDLT